MDQASVFLSFSSRDAELATSVQQGLLQRGFEVWKAPESIPPGLDWAAAIHKGIQEQKVFLLLWSDAAMASQEVSREIHLASQHHLLLLPLRLTEAMPQGGQAYYLGNIQWLEGQGLPVPLLLDRLEARIRELLMNPPQVAIPTNPAPSNPRPKISLLLFQVLVALLGLGSVACDLLPWHAANQGLLNQRLFWQARWRQFTAQNGPTTVQIGLLSLGMPTYKQLGVKPTDGSVNQEVLAQALKTLPSSGPPQRVGLDFILDSEGANPAGHIALADAIRQQRGRRTVIAGLCPPNSVTTPDCRKAADQRLATTLAAAGIKSASLTLGLNSEFSAPLQLTEPVAEGSMAGDIAGMQPRGWLPDGAVIDWSVNWLAPERIAVISTLRELANFRGDALLIASDGFKGQELSELADQHPSPQAVWAYYGQGPERFATTMQQGALPGGALQAVWAQSIRSGHWLQPLVPLMPTTLSTALLTAAAIWAVRQNLGRRVLLLGLAVASSFYIILALQLAVSLKRLLPISLPLSSAAVIVGLKCAKRLRS